MKSVVLVCTGRREGKTRPIMVRDTIGVESARGLFLAVCGNPMEPARKTPTISHAKTLSDVAAWSATQAVFRRNLRDWADHVRTLTELAPAIGSVLMAPRPLRGKFPEGAVADAWLAAYAEYVCLHVSAAIPGWALKANRFLAEPSFDAGVVDPRLRAVALDASPEAFRRRNIFTTTVDLPLQIRSDAFLL